MAFQRLMGQSQSVQLLTQAIAHQRVAPAYLFTGPDGVGRALAATDFIELLWQVDSAASVRHRIQQRNHPDLLWVEPTYLHQGQRLSATEAAAAGVKRKAPPQIRLEQIREISQFLSRSPLEAPRMVVVIEQAETMAEGASNALLKTLEEPGNATLILIAPGVESILPTLVSRCQRIPFYRLSESAIAQILSQTGHAEILQHPEILALAEGSPGSAIASWQQLQHIPADLLDQVRQIPRQSLRHGLDLARQIDKALDNEAQLWLVDYLQQVYWQAKPGEFKRLQALEQARYALLRYVQPRLVWEVTLIKLSETL
jgi:DNA polymerase III subunit delta'